MSRSIQQSDRRAEVLVIGSGPGGATTAHVLAERGKDVLILEEGRHLPLESCSPFGIEEMAQKYRAGGLNPTWGNSRLAFVEGRTVGGGSEINGGLYHRTPTDILEKWRTEFDVQESLAGDLLPHFEYCEKALGVTTYAGPAPLASRKLAEGARHMGWREMEVPRWVKFDGSVGPDGCPQGVRQSMTKTFVPRAVAGGARLLDETRALRLRPRGSGWIAEVVRNGTAFDIHADAVFVCGGAIQTPLLLRRSGITANVGNSLAMHPTVKAVAVFDEEVNHETLGIAVHQVKEFSPRMSFGCSISSLPFLALAQADRPGFQHEIKSSWRNMAVYYAMITGPHVGRIRPLLGLPDPWIRYHLSEQDLRDLATGLRRLTQLLLSAGARKIYPSIANAAPITREEDLDTLPTILPADRSNLMTIHLFSSCPMGEARARCAADSMGRVHDRQNLFINDASLIPTAPGVNPQGTVMALARRNALNFSGGL